MGGMMGGGYGEMAGMMMGMMTEAIGSYIQNKENRRATRHARKHQERMYKHRYQWAVEDLEAAGLNPVIALGPGPSTPGTPSPIPMQNPMSGMSRSARDAAKLKEEIGILKNQEEESRHRVHKTAYESAVAEQTALNLRDARKKIVADTELAKANARQTNVDTELLKTALPGARAIEEFDASKEGTTFRKLKRVIDVLRPTSQTVRGR